MPHTIEKPRVLLTGASGFVGKSLISYFKRGNEYDLKLTSTSNETIENIKTIKINSNNSAEEWAEVVKGCDYIIHTAAKVHCFKDNSPNPLLEYRAINVDWTLMLARQALKHKVKKFIYISSIKVNGEYTNHPFKNIDTPNPEDDYAMTKYEAERKLMELQKNSCMTVIIIRPPMIYGPGAKGNFASLISVIQKGYPLPFSGIHNKRSLVSIYNLMDLINFSLKDPNISSNILFVSDGEDLSIADLTNKISQVLEKKSRLFYFPVTLLKIIAIITGRKPLINRLLKSLQIDIDTTCELGWRPIMSVDESLTKMFQESK